MIREPDGLDTKFVNHVIANFNGSEFVVTLSQVIPPVQREGADWDAFLARRELEARVVSQVAMPIEKFVEVSDAFASMVARLRQSKLIPTASDSREEIES